MIRIAAAAVIVAAVGAAVAQDEVIPKITSDKGTLFFDAEDV